MVSKEALRQYVTRWQKASPLLQDIRDADTRAADTVAMIACLSKRLKLNSAHDEFRLGGTARLFSQTSPIMTDLVEEALKLQTFLEDKGWRFCFIG
jgi:hypothetical protein